LYISLIGKNIFHFLNILFSRLKRIYGKPDENLISGFLKRSKMEQRRVPNVDDKVIEAKFKKHNIYFLYHTQQ